MGRCASLEVIIGGLALSLFVAGCGGAGNYEEITGPDAVSGATDMPMEKIEEEEAPPEVHLCQRPIESPAEVWPRIEAVRLLPAQELTTQCGLPFVELVSEWRVLPVDLLAPIVTEAAKDRDGLSAWVMERLTSSPQAAASVVAMDAISSWKIGDDPVVLEDSVARWSDATASSEEIAALIKGIKEVKPILLDVNKIHTLRCMLEVNALGFAVQCKPIHPQGKEIALSWKTATRDGLIEKLELTKCKGPSCAKLKKTAQKLEKLYLPLVEKVDKLPVLVYREQIRAWMVLPPFKSQD